MRRRGGRGRRRGRRTRRQRVASATPGEDTPKHFHIEGNEVSAGLYDGKNVTVLGGHVDRSLSYGARVDAEVLAANVQGSHWGFGVGVGTVSAQAMADKDGYNGAGVGASVVEGSVNLGNPKGDPCASDDGYVRFGGLPAQGDSGDITSTPGTELAFTADAGELNLAAYTGLDCATPATGTAHLTLNAGAQAYAVIWKSDPSQLRLLVVSVSANGDGKAGVVDSGA